MVVSLCVLLRPQTKAPRSRTGGISEKATKSLRRGRQQAQRRRPQRPLAESQAHYTNAAIDVPISTGCQYSFAPRFADMSPRGRTTATDAIINHPGMATGAHAAMLAAGIRKGRGGGLQALGVHSEQSKPRGPHDSTNAQAALQPELKAHERVARSRVIAAAMARRDGMPPMCGIVVPSSRD